ncbi:saccharopine dehydrogenase NADP-binding domain-containing protein [Massilia sp. Mn16-1_5]|uniref:saccharopine dehydrogenase NADP-binding domain-containing protein n=1 Tax=Massilia sp. Mn16-1_5 TaxID=2079199 RepID=UPI00109E6D80|nr:saccharopine dehydrogenase NADP-binding domain-containing protein [Massilia sp. Mn16-1_5]THC42123.1 saccharopine dehydrogenase [Massilia sp. Mn16-1_5]
MSTYRVLIIGGYGFFGTRLATLLSRQRGLHILVAGRSLTAARALVDKLSPGASSQLEAQAIDIASPALAQTLSALHPGVVIHTAGPFQGQDYRVAAACIEAGTHYIDLADGRDFVAGIAALDQAATRAGVLVTSGASSVPALSCAAADALAAGMARVTNIDIGISPGNRTDPGLSTVRAILGYCGKPLPGGATGWRGTRTHTYPAPVGRRLLSPCDVPDLVVLGPRFPGRPQVDFNAGLELTLLHRGMNLMALLSQRGLVGNWADHAVWLKRVADRIRRFGSDTGAMHVHVRGASPAGVTLTRRWSLVAVDDDGPFVPTLAAAALVRRLAAGEMFPSGARPCLGLLSLQDFEREAAGLAITMKAEP